MTTLDQIKRSLFSASDLSDALAKLDAQRISYRECAVCEDTYHLIDHDVTFWVPRRGHPLSLHICIGDVIATAEYRENFFAQQQPELPQSVPAHGSLVAVEQIRIEVHLKSTPWEMFNRLFPSLAIFSHADTEISFISELKCRDNDPDDYVVHEPDMCIIRFSLGEREFYSVYHQCSDTAVLVGQFTSENAALDGINLYTDNEIYQHPFIALAQVDAA